MRRLSAAIGRPVSFALSQHNLAPDQWRDVLRLAQEANAEGADLRGQIGGRPLNLLIGFQTFHPFVARPTYAEARPPAAGRARGGAAQARDPRGDPLRDVAAHAARRGHRHRPRACCSRSASRPTTSRRPTRASPPSPRARAATPRRVLYDLMLGHDGRELVMKALLGYSYGNLDDMREMILHPNAVLGLSDGGAHCGAICDASHPHVHAHALDARPRPRRAPPARAGGAEADPRHRRGLRPRRPRRGRARLPRRPQRHRLRRAVARAARSWCTTCPAAPVGSSSAPTATAHTFVAGEETMRDGEETGARPGKLVRGMR